jgi:GntR family transcriptional regulator
VGNSWQDLSVDPSDPTPLHAQLERRIRVAIATGTLTEGDQLPTVRQLAVGLRINANTVAKVYSHLERTGTLQTRRGVGTFISPQRSLTQHLPARDSELQAVVARAVVEASSRGFSVADIRRQLDTLTKEQHSDGQEH